LSRHNEQFKKIKTNREIIRHVNKHHKYDSASSRDARHA
jgi:hypothetical protein